MINIICLRSVCRFIYFADSFFNIDKHGPNNSYSLSIKLLILISDKILRCVRVLFQ